MLDKVKEWLADFKVWATAAIAVFAEWSLGIIEAVSKLFG